MAKLGINAEEENNIISNFFFIIFMTNPLTRKVVVYIDGDLLKTSMTNEKFVSIIRRMCTNDMVNWVDLALTGYGDWFLIDRLQNSIEPLSPAVVFEKLDIKTIHEDVLKEFDLLKYKDGYKDLAIQEYQQKFGHSLNNQKDSTGRVIINKGAGRINYSIPAAKKKLI